MTSEIVTREEFMRRRSSSAKAMMENHRLLSRALEVKVEAGHDYMWVHQTTWMGEPCLQLPTDMMAMAEAIHKSQPEYIIECGVAWGGTSLYLASLLALSGGKSVIGIDVYIPNDVRDRIANSRVGNQVVLLEMSSTQQSTLDHVHSLISGSSRVLVLLDSLHTHDHVLAELNLYSSLIREGQYLICGDTAIDIQPPAPTRPRPWGPGNNPATALRQFLQTDTGRSFEVDTDIENRLLISNNWGGYLRRKM